jgi:hypothetical protein
LRYKRLPAFPRVEVDQPAAPDYHKWKADDTPDVGFGAEDVAKINPLLVTTIKRARSGVKYDRLSVIFVNAFKEQQTLIERQQQQIDAMQNSPAIRTLGPHLRRKNNENQRDCSQGFSDGALS